MAPAMTKLSQWPSPVNVHLNTSNESAHDIIHDANSRQALFASESSSRSCLPRMMWNDEDNNPYGTSFERRDSTASSTANPNSPGSREFLCTLAFGRSQDDGINLFR
jgi:hypothetical protein